MRAAAFASLAALSALLAAVPTASAAPAPTTLHLYVDPLQDFPITPQPPPAGFVVDSGLGLASDTFTCADNPPAARPFGNGHTLRGYAYPEPVEVNRGDEVSFHPARGIDGDVVLSGDSVVLHWFWAMDPAPGVSGGDAVPLAMPNVVVEATLRTGDDISIDDSTFDQGDVVASGASQPATLAGPATQGATYSDVHGQSVYEFTIPMAITAPVVPHDKGFNLRVDTYMLACGDGRVMPHTVAVFSDPDHRPRIDAALVDPLSGKLHVNVTGNRTLAVWAEPSSVLGLGDVANVTIAVTGPDGQAVEMQDLDKVTQGYGPCGHECGHRLVHLWLRVLQDAPPGSYDVNLSFTNQQGTATYTLSQKVTVAPDQAAPGLAPVVLLAGLAGAALLLRRRGPAS